MHPTNEIHRRPDGSIDTAHYARLGRELHGAAMRVSAASLLRLIGRRMKLIGRRRALLTSGQPETVFSAAE
jgi:hypothetical protein